MEVPDPMSRDYHTNTAYILNPHFDIEDDDSIEEYKLTVSFWHEEWDDFKGFYGSKPASCTEIDQEIDELELEGKSITLEDLYQKFDDLSVNEALERAMEVY